MSETVPHDRSDEVSDELRDTRDDASRAADRTKSLPMTVGDVPVVMGF
jgi:hypothetical protein